MSEVFSRTRAEKIFFMVKKRPGPVKFYLSRRVWGAEAAFRSDGLAQGVQYHSEDVPYDSAQ